jgi:dimethylargininase
MSFRPAGLALVRSPSSRLAEGEVTHLRRQALDVARAAAQHAAYVALLERHGYALVWVPPADEHPDGVFVEDALIVLGGDDGEGGQRASDPAIAILTRPGAASRRDEVASVASVIEALGLPAHRIVAPATLDGGDVLITARHVLVGLSSRSNAAAVEQLRALAAPRRQVLGIAVTGALHLKSAVTALPDGSLIAVPAWVDTAELASLGYRVHAALEPSGGDVLCLGEVVLLPADAPATAAMLRGLGFVVEFIDVSELQKIEAGVTCMSVLVPGSAR